MTVGAGAGDRQGEPDPRLLDRFCRVVVPGILTDVCHIEEELAAQVGADILARAESFAALDDAARDVLMSPFAEEVAGFEPAGSPLELKGAVAVVVRSSLLEEAHAHGDLEAGSIKAITTMAAAPLSHLLAARRRPRTVADSQFAGLAATYPRAWACLGAVARAYEAGGGRWPYHVTPAPVPDLPAAEVEAPRARSHQGAVVLSGIDPRFDQLFIKRMREIAEGGSDAVLITASLSRISRNLSKLMRAMEYLLAHDAPILTANYLLRPHEVWMRRGTLAPIDYHDPLAALRDSRGLSGAHRATATAVVKQMESGERAAGD
jgi:hypothetical protein